MRDCGCFHRYDEPKPGLFDKVQWFSQYWEGEYFYLISSGRSLVRFWHADDPGLPAFAGKHKNAPDRVKVAYQDRLEANRKRKAEKAAKASLMEATVIERQRETGCLEFVEWGGGSSPYCKVCNFRREEHS